MPPVPVTRRWVLQSTAGLGTAILSGCLFSTRYQAGSLHIDNRRFDQHTVTVTATKTSRDSDNSQRHDETPAPETTPIWTREATYTVQARARVREKGFIEEVGTFFLEARLDTGETASEWLELYEAAGGGVAENAIVVTIGEHGFTITQLHSD